MKKILIPAIVLVSFITLAFTSIIDGNWKGVAKENAEGDPFYVTLRLKTEGENVSGMVTSDFGNFDIVDGTFDGENLKFSWLMTFKEDSTYVTQKGRLVNDDLIIIYWGDIKKPTEVKLTRGEWSYHAQ